jgi:hypothetical protein
VCTGKSSVGAAGLPIDFLGREIVEGSHARLGECPVNVHAQKRWRAAALQIRFSDWEASRASQGSKSRREKLMLMTEGKYQQGQAEGIKRSGIPSILRGREL